MCTKPCMWFDEGNGVNPMHASNIIDDIMNTVKIQTQRQNCCFKETKLKIKKKKPYLLVT